MNEHDRHDDSTATNALTEPLAGTGTPTSTWPSTSPDAGPAPAPGTGPGAEAPTVRPQRGIRVRTLVFGLVLLAISASVLVTLLTTVQVDATTVTLVMLIGAGAALLAGGLVAAIRETRSGQQT